MKSLPVRSHHGSRQAATLALAVAATLAAAQVRAQGTDEQREACAPDAVKLCQDTIPDIPKTTACMKAHFAELSPRCKVAFKAVTGGASSPARGARRDEAAPPAAVVPDDGAAAPEAVPGLRAYRAYIRQSCRDHLIDPFTCRNALDALQAGD